ncbi:poly(hydroxyalkanoate) depolymerase family esterase [Sphingomonas zeicaulis]|uniref:extracellular catalytic domain type 1 short-chain-length polyhydroxyalkanoate depolymerase n=1 Tax=Sphingomonas zeicaulis TaxID=1632740 RepID=UPI003D211309
MSRQGEGMAAFQSSMAEALRLVRAGRIGQATVLLRSTIGMGPAMPQAPQPEPHAAPAPPPGEAGDVIDLEPHHVSYAPPRAPETEPAPRHAAEPEAVPSFEERLHKGRSGVLAYRLYRPAGATAGMPLVVMLHGCTQSPEDFAAGTGMNALADELGFLVAYPRQTQAANAQKCWNWFNPGDQQRDRGEPALIAGLTREILAKEGADPDRVYVAGLSAGGAAAAIMAATYPDLYAAVGIHSGLACGAARDLPSALMAMKRGGGGMKAGGQPFVPLISFHGDRDMVVHEVNAGEIVAAATAAAGTPLEVRHETGVSPSGRRYRRDLSRDAEGRTVIERWTLAGAGHAWSGGDAAGSYTDPAGPDASREMLRFFLQHRKP